MIQSQEHVCVACNVVHDMQEDRELGMVCGRCKKHTGNYNQGHHWAMCSALVKKGVPYKEALREFHFCCPDDCELEEKKE